MKRRNWWRNYQKRRSNQTKLGTIWFQREILHGAIPHFGLFLYSWFILYYFSLFQIIFIIFISFIIFFFKSFFFTPSNFFSSLFSSKTIRVLIVAILFVANYNNQKIVEDGLEEDLNNYWKKAQKKTADREEKLKEKTIN